MAYEISIWLLPVLIANPPPPKKTKRRTTAKTKA
jgi:hypothetical protein